MLTCLSYNLLICKIEIKIYLQYYYIYSGSSLFSVAVVCKVTVNAELANTGHKAPRGNVGSGSYRTLITFLLANVYITLYYVCFCLKPPCLIHTYIIDSLTLNSWQQRYHSCLNKASLAHVCFPQGTSQFSFTWEH